MQPNAAEEVVGIFRDLLRIDTTNTSDPENTVGENVAADYVARLLAEAEAEAEVLESAPDRVNVVAHIPSVDRSRGAVRLHGHLDVVPAEASEWSVPPFEGVEKDGYLCGRGAIDMKDFYAMILAVVRDWKRTGYVPPREEQLLRVTVWGMQSRVGRVLDRLGPKPRRGSA